MHIAAEQKLGSQSEIVQLGKAVQEFGVNNTQDLIRMDLENKARQTSQPNGAGPSEPTQEQLLKEMQDDPVAFVLKQNKALEEGIGQKLENAIQMMTQHQFKLFQDNAKTRMLADPEYRRDQDGFEQWKKDFKPSEAEY